MGLWPTHRDESALLRFIDSKQVPRDFRGSVTACLQQSLDRLRTKIGNRTSRSRPDEEGQVDFLKCQPADLAGSNTVDAVRSSLHMTTLVIDNDNNCL